MRAIISTRRATECSARSAAISTARMAVTSGFGGVRSATVADLGCPLHEVTTTELRGLVDRGRGKGRGAPWTKARMPVTEDCQMLCLPCNRTKSGK